MNLRIRCAFFYLSCGFIIGWLIVSRTVVFTWGKYLHLGLLGALSDTRRHVDGRFGVRSLPQSCGKIFDNFPSTYQYKAAAKNDCRQVVKFSSEYLPLTALASYPGSGNTWLRYLLQQATGILTGSMYCDLSLKRNGYFAEGIRNHSVIVIKTHVYQKKHLGYFDRAILLVRDPRDSLLADFNRERTHSHTDVHKDNVNQKSNSLYWDKRMHKWQNLYEEWLGYNGTLLVIQYKCLVSRLKHEVTRALKFLGMESSPEMLNCIQKNPNGQFLRKKNNTVSNSHQQYLHKTYSDTFVKDMLMDITETVGTRSSGESRRFFDFLNLDCT